MEIHAANGLLVNQFWWFLDIGRVDSTKPLRLDGSSSSSLEDHCRHLAADVVAAVVDEVGAHRVGVRLSPFAGGDADSTDAAEAHTLQLVRSIDKLGVLYCHVVEPRMRADGDGKPAASQDDKRRELVSWVREVGGPAATEFDFPTKGVLQAAVQGELWRMRDKDGRAPGMIGWLPEKAVTFVDNHDTGSTQRMWPFPADKVMQGYAYILTHPGIPCIVSP